MVKTVKLGNRKKAEFYSQRKIEGLIYCQERNSNFLFYIRKEAFTSFQYCVTHLRIKRDLQTRTVGLGFRDFCSSRRDLKYTLKIC